jgi:hypothetical protein
VKAKFIALALGLLASFFFDGETVGKIPTAIFIYIYKGCYKCTRCTKKQKKRKKEEERRKRKKKKI